MNINQSEFLRDVLIIGGVFFVSYVLATYFDVFETVVAFVELHEQWELDELITGVLILSGTLGAYSVFKALEVNKAKLELDKTVNDVKNVNEKLNVVGQLTRHDARNKLAVIANNLYLAKLSFSNSDELSKNLENAEKSINQIGAIFDFASVYEKLGVETPSKIDVGACVKEASNVLDVNNVTLINDCDGLLVLADSLLTPLFYNLMGNSLAHGESVTQIKVYPQKTGNCTKIIYEDNGVGVPENKKELIFKEGYGKGTGYGLFLIQKMCEAYGWTIKETGVHGKGARFEITICGTEQN